MRGENTRALWRVRPYLRPYVPQLATMVVLSLVSISAGLVVPLVMRRIVDGPIARGDRGAVLPLALVVLVLGLVETGLSFLRRWIQGGAANGFERTLRNDLYAHLQSLPVSFHDRWHSGQLLSRAMADMSVIRRFVGFGLVFLIVNSVTFVLVIALLFRLYAPLALVTAASILPLAFLSSRFRREYTAVSRRVQDQQGDLTTLVEEAATGIRVVKAFGRAPLVGSRYAESAARLRDSAIESTNLRATFWSLIDLVPNLTLIGVLVVGALAVGNGSLTLGGLVAFMSLVLMLVWPMESLGGIIATPGRPTPPPGASSRFSTPSRHRRPTGRRRLGLLVRAPALRGRRVPIPRRRRVGAAGRRSRRQAGGDAGPGRNDRLGQDHPAQPRPPPFRRHRRTRPARRT